MNIPGVTTFPGEGRGVVTPHVRVTVPLAVCEFNCTFSFSSHKRAVIKKMLKAIKKTLIMEVIPKVKVI